ncbi:MAG: hypothetical protein ABII39_06040 [Candidatus Micrarchaeota archaeon]
MIKEIETAFQQVTKILFGTSFSDVESYEEWLINNVDTTLESISPISKKPIYSPPVTYYKALLGRLLLMDEALEQGNAHISETEVEQLNLSNASKTLKNIKFGTSDVMFGKNSNMEKSAAYINSHYSFKSSFVCDTKYSAYCFWPRQSEYVFGSVLAFSCSFCINCYHSSNLKRCFELDNCDNCSDSYFCHNCENLSNCMFCFNTKAKQYAIGNVEVGKERYLEIKKILLNDICKQLQEKKMLDVDIYQLH